MVFLLYLRDHARPWVGEGEYALVAWKLSPSRVPTLVTTIFIFRSWSLDSWRNCSYPTLKLVNEHEQCPAHRFMQEIPLLIEYLCCELALATQSGKVTSKCLVSLHENKPNTLLFMNSKNVLAYLIPASKTSCLAVQGNVNESKTFQLARRLSLQASRFSSNLAHRRSVDIGFDST